MKFSDFKEKWYGYIGSGIRVNCLYRDKDFGCDIAIIGKENGRGGIQDCHIRNKNNVCVPIYMPEVWYQKIDPKEYRLSNSDLELLNDLGLIVCVINKTLEEYLNGHCNYISLYAHSEFGENKDDISLLEPKNVNDFMKDLASKFDEGLYNSNKTEESKINKYFHIETPIQKLLKE